MESLRRIIFRPLLAVNLTLNKLCNDRFFVVLSYYFDRDLTEFKEKFFAQKEKKNLQEIIFRVQ